MCDLSERALLFRCMVVRLKENNIGIFATSLGFAKCFCKPLFILQVIFIAWRSFCSLEIILQPKGIKKHIFPQPKGNFTGGSYGAAKSFRSQSGVSQPIFEAWSIFVAGADFVEEGDFRSPFRSQCSLLAF